MSIDKVLELLDSEISDADSQLCDLARKGDFANNLREWQITLNALKSFRDKLANELALVDA